MTKEQAFKNLSLPADADVETIRLRFAAVYTLSDVQYDRTLTEGMKEVHDKHLRELEQAYKTITDDPVIADMGALLSLGKGYVEEGYDVIGGEDTVSTEEALAFFALYPHDSPELAEQRYEYYIDELDHAIEQVGLEASKEPFRREIEQAKTYLTMVINYLLANQLLASQQGSIAIEEVESSNESRAEDVDEPIYATPVAAKPSRKRKFVIIGIVTILVLSIGYFLSTRNRAGDDLHTVSTDQRRDSIAWEAALAGNSQATYQHYLDRYPEGIFAQEAKESLARMSNQGTAQPKQTEDPEIEEMPTVVVPDLATRRSSPAIIQEILSKYITDYDINVTRSSITLIRDNLQRYVLPLKNIQSINAQGQFVGTSENLIVDGLPAKVTTGLHLQSMSSSDRKALISAIRNLAPSSTSNGSRVEKMENKAADIKNDTLDRPSRVPAEQKGDAKTGDTIDSISTIK